LIRKSIYILIFFIGITFSIRATEDLSGFWQTIDKKTKLPTAVIAIYSYQGKYFGRIVATYNKQGTIDETIYQPQSRAPGLVGNPYYCGLDIIWACSPDDKGYCKGHVIDPKEGKKYTAKIWKENGNLILRGELFLFGRNETLRPFSAEKFNQSFQQPNLTTFVPVASRLKK
jgi:uncharacterized protein (DUF2147 family)